MKVFVLVEISSIKYCLVEFIILAIDLMSFDRIIEAIVKSRSIYSQILFLSAINLTVYSYYSQSLGIVSIRGQFLNRF